MLHFWINLCFVCEPNDSDVSQTPTQHISRPTHSRRMSRYQKKHSPTHTHHGHQKSLSASSIYYNPWHPTYSIHALYSLFPQSLSKFSLVYLLAWHLPLHTPYISSPNHYLLFTAHAHTIVTCSAVVPRLCHLILVSLSTLYSRLYLVASHHILPFSSLPSDVPPHFPFLQARSHFHATYYFAHHSLLTAWWISLCFFFGAHQYTVFGSGTSRLHMLTKQLDLAFPAWYYVFSILITSLTLAIKL